MQCDTTRLARSFLAEPAGPVGHMAMQTILGRADCAQSLIRWCGAQTGARVAFALREANQWDIGRDVGLAVWTLWPDALVEEAQDRNRDLWPEELQSLMRWWRLPALDGLPEKVQVWRAGYGGFTWTAYRDVALWYALYRGGDIYTAVVDRDEADLWTNIRGEGECVLIDWPDAHEEVVHLADIHDGADRFRAVQQERRERGLPRRLYDEEG
jgi:hypothetical protein